MDNVQTMSSVVHSQLAKDGKMSTYYTVIIIGKNSGEKNLTKNFEKINELFSGKEFKDINNIPFIFDKGGLTVSTKNVMSDLFIWHGYFSKFSPDIFLTRFQHLDWSGMEFLEVNISADDPFRIGKWIYDPDGKFIARDDDFNGWHEIITNGWNRIDINYVREVTDFKDLGKLEIEKTEFIDLEKLEIKDPMISETFEKFSRNCNYQRVSLKRVGTIKKWTHTENTCVHSESPNHLCRSASCPLSERWA